MSTRVEADGGYLARALPRCAAGATWRLASPPAQLTLDVAALTLACLFAFGTGGAYPSLVADADASIRLAGAVSLGILCLTASGAYSGWRPLFPGPIGYLRAPLIGSVTAALVFALIRRLCGDPAGAGADAAYAGSAALLVSTARTCLQLAAHAAHSLGFARGRMLLVAPSSLAPELARRIRGALAPEFTIAGVTAIDLNSRTGRGDDAAETCARVADAAARTHATDILIVDPSLTPRDVTVFIGSLSPLARIRAGSRSLLALARSAGLAYDRLDDMGIVAFGPATGGALQRRLRRVFDCTISMAAIAALLPVWALVAAVMAAAQGRPVLYRQTRVAAGGKLFSLYKFRTMSTGAEACMMDAEFRRLNAVSGPMFKCRHDPRVTRLGRWLRRFSLDETPQFVNVLKGDISVVGVRPPLPEEVAAYHSWHHARLSGQMGITGLWQVSGRSDLAFDDVVILDILHNSRCSIAQDIRIIWKTVGAVVRGRGAY